MLKKLKAKFVAIIMILVGVVILAMTLVNIESARNGYIELTSSSLERVLEGGPDDKGGFLNKPNDAAAKNNAETQEGSEDTNDMSPLAGEPELLSSVGHLTIAWVDISETGSILGSNQDMVSIDSDMLQAAMTNACESGEDYGELPDYHLVWQKKATINGYRIAIADTSSTDQALFKQTVSALAVCGIALLILFIGANLLANWMLAPVEKAWEQQHQFVADASHELKTPLSVILANTQILSQDAKSMSDEDARWVASTADEAKRMRSLVEELLELARTEEVGDAARRNIDVDLSDIVEGEAMQFDALAFEKGCTIETNVNENLHVLGDPEELERLAKTLIDNACKYAAKDSAIKVGLSKQGKDAYLDVTNFGTPIDAEDLPHVFDRFYRSDKARARETGGFGLGLAIARGIAESHGGKISCTSSETKGTCFSVKLPLAQK